MGDCSSKYLKNKKDSTYEIESVTYCEQTFVQSPRLSFTNTANNSPTLSFTNNSSPTSVKRKIKRKLSTDIHPLQQGEMPNLNNSSTSIKRKSLIVIHPLKQGEMSKSSTDIHPFQGEEIPECSI